MSWLLRILLAITIGGIVVFSVTSTARGSTMG
jgi:hypothetical protein